MTTATVETDRPAVAAQAIADRTCADAWKAISWSKDDTDQTIDEVKANNRARVAWGCTP